MRDAGVREPRPVVTSGSGLLFSTVRHTGSGYYNRGKMDIRQILARSMLAVLRKADRPACGVMVEGRTGPNDHTKPFKGDKGIRFEPIEK